MYDGDEWWDESWLDRNYTGAPDEGLRTVYTQNYIKRMWRLKRAIVNANSWGNFDRVQALHAARNRLEKHYRMQ